MNAPLATIKNRLGDLCLSSHRIDRHQGTLQVEVLQQQRNGGDLVGFLLARLLPQHDPLSGGPGGNHMQGLAPPGVVVAAS